MQEFVRNVKPLTISLLLTHYPQELELLQEAMDLRLAFATMLLDTMKTPLIHVQTLLVWMSDKTQVTLVGLILD